VVYAGTIAAIAWFWLWSLTPVVRVWGGVLFLWFYAIGLAKNRKRFLRGLRIWSRATAAAATALCVTAIVLRATGS
jgi:hypothetical protein